MVQEAEQNAESDKKQKELIESRNSAEAQVHNIKRDMDEVKDQLSDEEKTAVETAITAVEEAMKGEDVEAITTSVTSLFESATPVMTKKQAAEQAKEQAEANPGAEQTVDASFKEV
jgi:molecular chaperone DnaK